MVVTSRMLAAHTNGYPMDVRSRFWSHYYRSLKEIASEDPNYQRVSESLGTPRYRAPSPLPNSFNSIPGAYNYPSSVFPPLNPISNISRPYTRY
ncbi:hypothetical protein Anas_03192 [Armadillidium nasatum]|uniref:Uncharacterized protein n=1 Tax=Armadillidium nasatum TaxID=96803 RepID=A0A5N5TFK1_9CRUS|nr:hypothetical protein Anas_03192 [Armadillidium nasatum]